VNTLSLTREVFQVLLKNQQTLSVAESCSGGGLANEISKIAGISQIFLGSITSYANKAKVEILKVPNHVIAEKGAVSEEVAIYMAKNCRIIFKSTWALSTTGIAGPSGGSPKKPIGLVWIGLAGPNINFAKKFLFLNISRLKHRRKTIDNALQMLINQCSQIEVI
jgi:nicotinamide-nucleotide amidase